MSPRSMYRSVLSIAGVISAVGATATTILLGACLVVPVPTSGPSPNASTEPAGPALTPHPPINCQGSEDIVLDGVYIETPDNGIQVLGNCDITITNSHINAGGMAIYIAGNGDVTIEDSIVEGARAAVSIHGNGDVFMARCRILGPTEVLGNGDIEDGGDNVWQ